MVRYGSRVLAPALAALALQGESQAEVEREVERFVGIDGAQGGVVRKVVTEPRLRVDAEGGRNAVLEADTEIEGELPR